MKFTSHSRTGSPLNGTCFLSSFFCQEFVHGFQVFGKLHESRHYGTCEQNYCPAQSLIITCTINHSIFHFQQILMSNKYLNKCRSGLCSFDLYKFGITRFINLGMFSVCTDKNLHLHGLKPSKRRREFLSHTLLKHPLCRKSKQGSQLDVSCA